MSEDFMRKKNYINRIPPQEPHTNPEVQSLTFWFLPYLEDKVLLEERLSSWILCVAGSFSNFYIERTKLYKMILGIPALKMWVQDRTELDEAEYLSRFYEKPLEEICEKFKLDSNSNKVLHSYAIVLFSTRDDAELAIKVLHGVYLLYSNYECLQC